MDEIFSLDRIGIHDNFFDVGGHSLAATRVVARVIQSFQLELPVETLFQSPTVAAMADVIARHDAKKSTFEDLRRMMVELEAMSEDEAERRLATAGPPNSRKDGHE